MNMDLGVCRVDVCVRVFVGCIQIDKRTKLTAIIIFHCYLNKGLVLFICILTGHPPNGGLC